MSTPTLLTPTHRTSASVRAPRRFDTHSLAVVEGQIAEQRSAGTGPLVLDASDVVFVDRDAVDMLVGAGLDRSDDGVRIEQSSLAVQITLELLGHLPTPLERAA